MLTLAAAIVVAPLPALAGDSLSTPRAPGIAASAQKAAETTVLKSSARMSQGAGQTTTDLGSPSFFKTKAGVITLVLVGAGVGFAVYSTSHDRVKSPGK